MATVKVALLQANLDVHIGIGSDTQRVRPAGRDLSALLMDHMGIRRGTGGGGSSQGSHKGSQTDNASHPECRLEFAKDGSTLKGGGPEFQEEEMAIFKAPDLGLSGWSLVPTKERARHHRQVTKQAKTARRPSPSKIIIVS